MGVYIKGMRMPENCCECEIRSYDANAEEEYCPFNQIECLSIGIQDNCPLVKVPEPHGDLVDRNILEQELRNGIKAGNLEEGYEHYANINNMDDCVECVKYADTVIEAEGE